jgi:hypothetical protein
MRKLFLAIVLFSSGQFLFAQKLHLFATAGIMNYQGDLQPQRISFQQVKPCFGIGAYYEITDKLYVRLGLVAGKVSASDAISKVYKIRNLSFETPVNEIHLGLEYDIFNIYDHSLVPFIFAGIGAFQFKPSAIDATGRQVYLQPLGTEGQGYNGTAKYSLNQMVIPFGGGLKFAINENVHVRLEALLRKTFTDYLDDVSNRYVNQADLIANNGQKAFEMAYRGDEIGLLTYPEGAVRGNPKSKDYYYTSTLSVSFRIQSNYDRGSTKGRAKTGCPVNVY